MPVFTAQVANKSVHKLFLSADEPIDVRRKKSMEHLKVRAEHDGKMAEYRNEVLFVDRNAVFSVKAVNTIKYGEH